MLEHIYYHIGIVARDYQEQYVVVVVSQRAANRPASSPAYRWCKSIGTS